MFRAARPLSCKVSTKAGMVQVGLGNRTLLELVAITLGNPLPLSAVRVPLTYVDGAIPLARNATKHVVTKLGCESRRSAGGRVNQCLFVGDVQCLQSLSSTSRRDATPGDSYDTKQVVKEPSPSPAGAFCLLRRNGIGRQILSNKTRFPRFASSLGSFEATSTLAAFPGRGSVRSPSRGELDLPAELECYPHRRASRRMCHILGTRQPRFGQEAHGVLRLP